MTTEHKNANWLQGQDLNLRFRGYEPRGMTRLPYPAKRKDRRSLKARCSGGEMRVLTTRAGEHHCGPGSFGGLRDINRTIHTLGPFGISRPVPREKQHRSFVDLRGEIAALGDVVEL